MLRSMFRLKLLVAAAALLASNATFADNESGLAAIYNYRLHGHKTACGEVYNKNALTTAHQTLPCGSKVKITNQKNHKSVVLRVTDRGPTQAGRIVDVSTRAAKALGMHRVDLTPVELKVIKKGKP